MNNHDFANLFFSNNPKIYEKYLKQKNQEKYKEESSKFPYKDFVEKCVPEDEKSLAYAFLIGDYKNEYKIRQGLLERHIFDESIQMPRQKFLKKMNKDENLAMINLLEDFWNSRGRKSGFSFAVLAVGSNLYNQEEIKEYFKKEGLKKNDFLKEFTNDQGSDEEIFKERKLKVKDILDNKHNDIDLLICPDFNHFTKLHIWDKVKEKESWEDCCSSKITLEYYEKFYRYLSDKNISVKKEKASQLGFSFYKNPENKEIIRMKGISYSSLTLKIDYKKCIRPFHIYFDHNLAELKIKQDLLKRIPFSVLLRRSDISDLKYAFYNGINKGIYENPLFVKK